MMLCRVPTARTIGNNGMVVQGFTCSSGEADGGGGGGNEV